MSVGKLELLGQIVDGLVRDPKRSITGCVVTNDRGMIIAGRTKDGASDQTLAAMISLLSSTAERVNRNLGIGYPKLTLIKSLGVKVSVMEFTVRNKRFRMGAMLTESNNGRRSFIRRRISDRKTEATLENAVQNVRSVLESN
ncbi:MAG: hypothetical protein ACFFF4_00785 [Candidatus Thorarchaeota archaeon]